jgi:2-hydroxymuconate-semialdehyde hydrolase
VIPTLDRRRVTVSAGEMAYVDVGDGPAVVLVHGFPTSSHLWRREAWLFAQRMRVIAPDLMGYGESDKPTGVDLSELAQAGYVEELLAALGVEEVAVVGHDIGGGVAQLLALGGRVRVRAMGLLDSVCFDAWPNQGVRMLQDALPDQHTAPFVEDVVRLALDLGVAHGAALEPDVVETYLQPWTRDPPAFFRAARAITGRGLAGREADLAALDVPALILWGEEDPYLPVELAERLGETMDQATVALLPGCSHFVTEDAPQTVGPLLFEFLRARYLGERHGHAAREPVLVYLERPAEPFFDRGSGEER